jgi:hypothetical protein
MLVTCRIIHHLRVGFFAVKRQQDCVAKSKHELPLGSRDDVTTFFAAFVPVRRMRSIEQQ